MRPSLQRFEAIAQRLVEGSLVRLFGGSIDPLEISTELARAIEDYQREGFAPNQFVVALHPEDYADLRRRWPDAIAVLTHYALQIARELSLRLHSDPIIEITAAPDVSRRFVRVDAAHDRPEQSTQLYQPVASFDPLQAMRDLDAFVIVNGRRHIDLDKPVMTIGRRTDCDIILDSRSVSRRHAQLRWRFGRFVLYDLGSRAGTLVNDRPISELALRPGDVITLAGQTLIYGEGQSDDDQQVTVPHPDSADE